MTDHTLKGKTALITGSTSGIGLAAAQRLAKAGAHIVINGIAPQDVVDGILDDLKKNGVEAIFSAADMSKPAEIQEMAKTVIAKFGAVDILINNAGIQHVEAITEFPDDKWDAIIAINLSSAFHTIKAFAPGMKEKKWGRIIQTCSVHGLIASEYKSAYVAAKHGIMGLTKTAALDLAAFGITVNAICPGYVNTPLVQKQIPEQAKSHGISEDKVVSDIFLKAHAIKEFVEEDDIAEMVLFLTGNAARHITGTPLIIDCGWTAQ